MRPRADRYRPPTGPAATELIATGPTVAPNPTGYRRAAATARALALTGLLLLAAGCAASDHRDASATAQRDTVHAPEHGPSLHTADQRRRMNIAGGGDAAPYNYAPSVMRDGDETKMWWCSQLPGAGAAGDDVLYAEAPDTDGPYGAARAVFSGSGGGSFDAVHTCDPSVIRVHGTYYLYYTGAAEDREHGNAVGVAESDDGVHWRRCADGRSIARPSMGVTGGNTYGAGQPSALYLDGWYYLLYTDTSNRSAGWNGAGQFVLRAKDPTFAEQVQGLTDRGFVDEGLITPGNAKSIVDAFSADWMYSDALGAFAVAHETDSGTRITFYDRQLRTQPYRPITLGGPWREGPGLVRRADGHAPVSRTDPCGRVPVDVVRATAGGRTPTGLSHFGTDVTGVDGCGDTSKALGVLAGQGVISPERTVDLVLPEGLVRVQRRSVAAALTPRIVDRSIPALAHAPVLARLNPAAPARQVPGGPVGLVLSDGKLWPVGDGTNVARLNGSAVTELTQGRWDTCPHGRDLSRLGG